MSRANRKPNKQSTGRRGRGDASQAASTSLSGFHPVREALRARRRRIDCLVVRSVGQRAEHVELIELARSQGVDVELVEPRALDEQLGSEGNDQGIGLRVGPLPELTLDELIDHAVEAPGEGSRLVVLDGVEDPQNVGALARVAESAGAHGLILTERRAPDLTPAVSRASAGAIEWLRVARVSNLSRALNRLKERDYWVLAAALGTDGTLFEMKDPILTGNLALVLGAEGKGVRRSILELADHRVEIPMRGEIASLNVSTAAAVILYDLLRRAS